MILDHNFASRVRRLSRTPSGKIKKAELRAQLAQP